jgi:DNA-binding NtrC family response regulator
MNRAEHRKALEAIEALIALSEGFSSNPDSPVGSELNRICDVWRDHFLSDYAEDGLRQLCEERQQADEDGFDDPDMFREAVCKRRIEDWLQGVNKRLIKMIIHDASDLEQWVVRLGMRVDQGVRPDDVYRDMWETRSSNNDDDDDDTYSEPGEGGKSAPRPPPTWEDYVFANRVVEPGSVKPRGHWRPAVQTLLKRLYATLPSITPKLLDLGDESCVDPRRIVAELTERIHEALEQPVRPETTRTQGDQRPGSCHKRDEPEFDDDIEKVAFPMHLEIPKSMSRPIGNSMQSLPVNATPSLQNNPPVAVATEPPASAAPSAAANATGDALTSSEESSTTPDQRNAPSTAAATLPPASAAPSAAANATGDVPTSPVGPVGTVATSGPQDDPLVAAGTRHPESAEPQGPVQLADDVAAAEPTHESANEKTRTGRCQQESALFPGDVQPINHLEFERLLKIKNKIDPKNKYIGESIAILRVFEKIKEFNELPDDPVLILGPTGAGKTAIAELIHSSSARSTKPFQKEQAAGNKAADPAILTGRWAGYGAGSGLPAVAEGGQNGILHQCNQGTVFVDEVADLGDHFQGFLLHVLDNETIAAAAGRPEYIKANVRLIFATNGDLELLVKEGKFKHDLYRRIKGRTIHIPPLGDRPEDIFFFVREKCEGHKSTAGFLLCLLRHKWPGNVGELYDVLKLAASKAKSPKVRLSPDLLELNDLSIAADVHKLTKEQQVREVYQLLAKALQQQGLSKGRGLQERMAKILAVSSATVSRYVRKYLVLDKQ